MPLRPAPGEGGRRKGTLALRSSVSCRASYVHATRLPFDPGSPTAYVHARGTTSSWRGFGARDSRRYGEMCRQKQVLMHDAISGVERLSSLSLSGGASIRSRAFQAEHHLLVAHGGRLQKRRRRPGWVALDWLRYAASWLARTPPSEGSDDVVQARRMDGARERRFRRGGRREGGQTLDVDVDAHCSSRRIEHRATQIKV